MDLDFRLNVYYTRGGGKKYSSFLFEELLRSNSCGITGSLAECRGHESIAKRTKDNGTEVDILAEVFTHSCGCSSSTLIIREWRGCLEGWPRLEFYCYVFRNSTFKIFRREFRFSSRCAGISKFDKRFGDKYNKDLILLFVAFCKASFFFFHNCFSSIVIISFTQRYVLM